MIVSIQSYQLQLIKMRSGLANLNHYAVPFLSRAAVNLSWYDSSDYSEYPVQYFLNNILGDAKTLNISPL